MRDWVTKITWASVLVSGCAFLGCGNDGGGAADGGGGSGGSGQMMDVTGGDRGLVACIDGGPTACPSPPVTYAMVAPILQARCVSVCHNDMTPDPNNNNMPIWSIKDYKHVQDWADLIREAIAFCSMPPANSGVPLTVEERRAILEFIRCGLPQ